ncbi:MAG: 3'-5' exonuclease [Clostridia bacterium]|nr:3'-5' exonuclease [Clostridia bacterium]
MRLLFFDIECACVYKNVAKICSFGYVLCDDKFNILQKRDILVNPRGKFHLTDGRGEKGIVLPYDEDFRRFPAFPGVYDEIRALLEDKNNMVYGHAVENDIKYLNLETRRYSLPPFHFSFSDTQLIYRTLIGDFTQCPGLETMASQLGIEFKPHRSEDDAYVTMCVLKKICENTGCSVYELKKRLQLHRGSTHNMHVQAPTSNAYMAFQEKKKHEKELKEQAMNAITEHILMMHEKPSGALKGSTFNFNPELEADTDKCLPLIDRIYELGGAYSHHMSRCNIYVEGDSDDSIRTRMAHEREDLEIITLSRLEEMLHGAS